MRERLLPLAVDLGSTRVRVIGAARAANGTLRLLGMGSAGLESGMDATGALRAAVRETALRQRDCRLMVRSADAPLRWLGLPPMPARDRARAMLFEGRAALDTTGEVVVRARAAGDGRTLLGAVMRSTIAELRTAAQVAGLRVARIEHAGLVLAGAAGVPVLDIGSEQTTLALEANAVPLVRTVQSGGETFTRALMRELGIDRERAERRKQTLGLGGAAQAELRVFIGSIGETLRELHRTERVEMRELFVCGNGARLIGLRESLAEGLGIPVRAARLERLVQDASAIDLAGGGACEWFAATALAAAEGAS